MISNVKSKTFPTIPAVLLCFYREQYQLSRIFKSNRFSLNFSLQASLGSPSGHHQKAHNNFITFGPLTSKAENGADQAIVNL